MIVIVSPAKKLNFEIPAPTKKFTQLKELEKSQQLIKELKKRSPDEISKHMKLSESLTDLNIKRYKKFKPPFNLENSKQALFAFKGDTYVGLDAETMKSDEISFAQKHLRILSGLYGLVCPLDLIQPYRLEMGTKLPCSGNKNLYEFWSETITGQLQSELKKEKTLINLASKEYFTVVNVKKLDAQIITPQFKEKKDGDFKMIGLFAKRARGMMSRYIVDKRISDPREILEFDRDGYKYNKKLSTEQGPVFTRG